MENPARVRVSRGRAHLGRQKAMREAVPKMTKM